MIDETKISAMRQGGKKLAAVRQTVVNAIKPGISLADLDALAEKLILQAGGEPGFKRVPGYHWTTCINVNEGIVHGIPHKSIRLKSGDLVSLDMGMYYQGYNTDTSITQVAGKASQAQKRFLRVGKKALKKAIAFAQPQNYVGHISKAIQEEVEKAGYSCARNLTGHGVGKSLHEPPMIPCVLKGQVTDTPKLQIGMTLAIEVIYSQGSWKTDKLDDGWTIITQDRQPAGLFEETVLIGQQGAEILT